MKHQQQQPLAPPVPAPEVEALIGPAGPKGRRATRVTVRNILEVDPRWQGRLRWNELSEQLELDGRALGGEAVTRLGCWLEEVYQVCASRDLLFEVARLVGANHQAHPVREWLSSLTWDGTSRTDSLFVRGLGGAAQPLHHAMGTAFLVGAVARVMKPGCKLDTLPVLVGAQGAGKSRFCAALVPVPAWFGDTPFDLRSKDAYVALRGKWLYEVAELESLQGRSSTRVKAFLSSPIDRYRAPYARAAEDHPRHCVFIGTSNEVELLSDATGSRRLWPIAVGAVDVRWVEEHREQLWAEAVVRFRRGEPWHLSPEMEQRRQAAADAFRRTDPRREMLEQWLSTVHGPFTTVQALTHGLGVSVSRADHRLQTRVGSMLHELGCTRTRIRAGGTRTRAWLPPASENATTRNAKPQQETKPQ